jgi:cysteine-rich repeat protein
MTSCGNGIPTTGEACDDGNGTNGDGCDVNCTVSACGNGIPAPGEQCDDGNATNGDGCDSNCTTTGCGNGIPTGTEACDDGNANNGDGCDSNCTVSACGNGIVASNEECDDGNSTPLDGCSLDCTLEPLEKEPNEDGTPSTGGTGTNGNDFGTANPDANGAFTRSTTIRAALSPVGDEDIFLIRNTSTLPQVVTLETWNAALGVGVPCNTTIDTVINVRNSAGVSLAVNDDRVEGVETCSTLLYVLQPGASAYAQVTAYNDNAAIAGYVLDLAFRGVICGDGTVNPGEQCDDGNATSGDGCSSTCQLETRTEVEPNNTNAQATSNVVQITGDTTIQAAITPIADVDTFRVTVTAPTVIRFETFSSLYQCTATSTIDLRLFDAAGTAIVADTASSGIGPCGAIVIPLAAGTYFIRAEERGNNAALASYLLQVDYQTDRGVEAEAAMSTGANDTIQTSDRALKDGDNVYAFGNHIDTEDVDVYAISVPGGMGIRAEIVEGDRVMETCESNGIDSRLTLFDSAGTQLADNDDSGRGFCSLIDGTGGGTGVAPLHPLARNNSSASQIFYVMAWRSDLAAGTQQVFSYRLQVTFH